MAIDRLTSPFRHPRNPGPSRRACPRPSASAPLPALPALPVIPALLAFLLAAFPGAPAAQIATQPLARPASDSVLRLKANFYDFPIDAFAGEFGSRVPGQCGYDKDTRTQNKGSFSIIDGMLKDTLLFSKLEGKKYPRRDTANCNSLNIEKWFLPAHATSATCQELAFRRADTLGRSGWLKREARFFPIDSLAPAGQLEGGRFGWDPRLRDLTGADTAAHNFNWCMEVNAQFTYRKGQEFRLDGEDDVWLYIDNQLVVDLGGIHGSGNTRIVRMDSLPFIAGREGEVFDFDLYQCERRPGGSEIFALLDANFVLEAPKFVDLEMVYPDKSYPNPRHPIAGLARFCAQPVYASPAPCANDLPVPADPFVKATWTLGDKVLARDSACIDFDPRGLPPNVRMELVAKAEGKTARLPLQVGRANFPTALVLAGNGRVDSVILKLDPRSDSLFEPLSVTFTLGGEERTYRSAPSLFRPASRSVVWTLPGTGRGLTAPTAEDSLSAHVDQTVFGKPFFNAVTLVDSATPAVLRAAWTPREDGGYDLALIPTEPLAVPFPQPLDAFLFKDSRGRLLTPSAAGVVQAVQADGSLRVAFPPGGVDPRGLDSVSFSGAVRDRAGNYARLLFTAIDPLAWGAGRAEIAAAYIENSPARSRPFFLPQPAGPSLVLLGADGRALIPGAANDHLAGSGGPVLVIRSPDPVEWVDLKFYSNLGAFLHAERYVLTLQEWEALKAGMAGTAGDTVTARLLWHPVSRGAKLGTGAYIVKGTIATRRTWSRAPAGTWQERASTLRLLGPLRFGFLRE